MYSTHFLSLLFLFRKPSSSVGGASINVNRLINEESAMLMLKM